MCQSINIFFFIILFFSKITLSTTRVISIVYLLIRPMLLIRNSKVYFEEVTRHFLIVKVFLQEIISIIIFNKMLIPV